MAKQTFIITLERYVQEIATIEVEAESMAAAAQDAHRQFWDGEVDLDWEWGDGTNTVVYSVVSDDGQQSVSTDEISQRDGIHGAGRLDLCLMNHIDHVKGEDARFKAEGEAYLIGAACAASHPDSTPRAPSL